MIRKITMVLLH